ncbi:MAG TPA: CPBP family intramembrane glutamic endopeptidase [Candidatus Eremiobacteraceae bacterium]|nr:CPBP family intramembrane glutamic endopeptidase [Candidatus Eremiobacteraceae bacterium]
MDIASPQPVATLSAGPEPAFHKRWSGWTVVWIFVALAFLYIGVQIAATIVLLYVKFPDVMAAAAHGDRGPLMGLASPSGLARLLTPTGFLMIQLPTTVVMVGATLVLARGALGATLADLGFGKPITGNTVAWGLGAGLVLFVISLGLELAQDALFGPHPQQIALILAQHHGIASLILDLISAALLAPLWEETFFRGVFFTALVQRMPFWLAATLSGLAFGLAHGDLWNLVPLAALGFGLAFVYYRTGNIWANIMTHATINGLDLIIQALFPQLPT